jgi:hypothetical protein
MEMPMGGWRVQLAFAVIFSPICGSNIEYILDSKN